MSRYYITTAIDYVNARPHVGHAFEKVQADAIARFHRDFLKEDTYFLTGSDENSLKNVQAAKKANLSVSELVDQNSGYFEKLKDLLDLSFDQFIRTTDPKHFAGAQKLWSSFDPNDIYKKNYKGFYCVGCEEFKTEKDLVDGKCPEHNMVPELIEEENYFFRLSNYKDKLLNLIETGQLVITPDFRKNEILSFIKGGLEDFSISRSKKRAENWGVPVPNDPDQIMYVWVDALSNYITALDYADNGDLYQKYWLDKETQRTHVIGKGILRFHAVYWPAMLLSAKTFEPLHIASHEYLTINGQKMSKSLGNIIEPEEIVNRYGRDASRYLLLSSMPYFSDGDISFAKMDEKYTADLANNLGNLVQRTISMVNKYEVKVRKPEETFIWKKEFEDKFYFDAFFDGIGNEVKSFAKELEGYITEVNTFQATLEINNLVSKLNNFIGKKEPWKLAKENMEECAHVLSFAYEALLGIAEVLEPFMPDTSEKMKKQLETLVPEPLFPRLETSQ